MAADISVKVGVEGETKFKKALEECRNTIKQLDSSLKANAAEYEANADALGENAERTKLLKQSIEAQKKLIDEMGDAIKYATDQYGAASKQTTKYVVAQNKAKEALAKLEKEFKDTDREMEELGRDSIRVGRQLESGIGDGAEEVAKNLEGIGDILDSIESIEGMMNLSVGVDLVGNVVEGVGAILEGSEDFNRKLSYINQNAKESGISLETIGKNLAYATGVTGEFEGAVEGLSNLLGAKLDAKELADAMNLLLGAVINVPETFKFETLAEGLRETLQQKQAVGQFADLLSYLSVDIETFNKAMEKTGTLESAQDVLLNFTANRGLEETLTGWAKENKDMLDAADAAYKLNTNVGELAKTMQPLGTAWTDMSSAAIKAVTSLLENTEVDEWIVNVLDGITELITYIDDYLNEEGEWKPEVIAQTEMKLIDDEIRRLETLIREAEEAGNQFMKNKYTGELEAYKEERKALEEALKESGISVDMTESGEMAGESIVSGMTEAIEDETPELQRAAAAAVDAVNTELEQVTVPDIAGTLRDWEYWMNRVGGGAVGGGGVNVRETSSTRGAEINFNINGTRFWSAHIDDINAVQGRTIELT